VRNLRADAIQQVAQLAAAGAAGLKPEKCARAHRTFPGGGGALEEGSTRGSIPAQSRPQQGGRQAGEATGGSGRGRHHARRLYRPPPRHRGWWARSLRTKRQIIAWKAASGRSIGSPRACSRAVVEKSIDHVPSRRRPNYPYDVPMSSVDICGMKLGTKVGNTRVRGSHASNCLSRPRDSWTSSRQARQDPVEVRRTLSPGSRANSGRGVATQKPAYGAAPRGQLHAWAGMRATGTPTGPGRARSRSRAGKVRFVHPYRVRGDCGQVVNGKWSPHSGGLNKLSASPRRCGGEINIQRLGFELSFLSEDQLRPTYGLRMKESTRARCVHPDSTHTAQGRFIGEPATALVVRARGLGNCHS